MKRCAISICSVLILTITISMSTGIADDLVPGVIYKDGPVKGKMIDAGFLYGDSNYHAIIHASDGNVYYVICSHNKKAGARLFRYNPRNGAVDMVGDLTDIAGEDRTKVINQGKVHGDLYEFNGKLYFGTHAGAYDRTYPGGHFMSYDLKTGKFVDFGIGAPAQGLVAMSMDIKRGRMYAVTWPGYTFLYYDINTKKTERWMEAIAPVIQQGPRSLGIDPRTGNVYWHNMNENIYCFDYGKNEVETLTEPKFDAPMFHIPLDRSVEAVWRSIRWSKSMQCFYGIMYYSDWLFSFEPKSAELEIIDRIAAAPNRKSGKTTYSSLAFEMSNDGKTVYYIAPNTVEKPDGSESDSELHLVTYDIPLRRYVDHGVIELSDGRRPRYCQGLEVGRNGKLYIVAWIKMTDKNSEKWKMKLEIDTGGKPELAIERSKNLQEINLIEIQNPLAK
ncbi:hypothetical protein ACFL1R_09940 [Candidatus Latescibacterota bacterium]